MAPGGSRRQALARVMAHPATDIGVILLIFSSVSLLLLQPVYELEDPAFAHRLQLAGDVITGLFAIELYCRYLIESRKRRFFRRYWLDLLSLIPIFRPMRVLRVLVLLRVFRVGRMMSRRMLRMDSVLVRGLAEHMALIIVIAAVVIGSATAIVLVEGRSNPDFDTFYEAVRWSMLSLVAGEPVQGTPRTLVGWLVQLVLMLGGITVFAVFTGVVAALMTQSLRVGLEEKDMDLDELSGHIVVCGWNRLAPVILRELQTDQRYQDTPIVLVAEVDRAEEQHDLQGLDRSALYVIREDYTTLEALERSGIERASTAIVLADKTRPRSDQDRDARTVLAALTIEKLNADIFTCVELLHRENGSHLRMAGVEEIVVGDEYSAHIIASASKNQGIVSLITEVLTHSYGNQFYKCAVPGAWVGRSVGEIYGRLKGELDAVLVALECESEGMRVNPPVSTSLRAEDKLVLMCAQEVAISNLRPPGSGASGA